MHFYLTIFCIETKVRRICEKKIHRSVSTYGAVKSEKMDENVSRQTGQPLNLNTETSRAPA